MRHDIGFQFDLGRAQGSLQLRKKSLELVQYILLYPIVLPIPILISGCISIAIGGAISQLIYVIITLATHDHWPAPSSSGYDMFSPREFDSHIMSYPTYLIDWFKGNLKESWFSHEICGGFYKLSLQQIKEESYIPYKRKH